MIVRCGRCQSGFEVPGPGQHACPACGTVNEVRAAAEPPTAGPVEAPAPPAPPAEPSPRVSCGECGFTFIVGAVEEAPCPNCGAVVAVGHGAGSGS